MVRRLLRGAAIAAILAGAAGSLGACDALLRIGQPDRFIDPHVDCSGFECVCTGGFDDCDDDADDGCETDLASDPENCGTCGNICFNGLCAGGGCACNEGFADCNGQGFDGCESEAATDPDNCGACGRSCLGGLCQAGACQPITVSGLDGAKSIAVGGGSIFIARCGDPAVAAAPVDGGDLTGVGMTQGCAGLVAFAGDNVFWVGEDKAVSTTTIDALGSSEQLAAGTNPAIHFAAGSAHVYWWGDDAVDPALYRVPIHGGTAEKIASTTPSGLAVDGAAAYWSDGGGIHAVAVDSPAVTDVDTTVGPTKLAVSEGLLFLGTSEGLASIPTTGGSPTLLVPAALPLAVAADAAHVYWAEKSDGSVRRAGRDGSDVTVLAAGEPFGPSVPFVIDDEAVYWIADASVRKVAK